MLERKKFKQFRKDIDAALEEIKEKYNCSINQGNINFTETEASIKLNFKKIDHRPVEEIRREKFVENAAEFGFTNDDFGTRFKVAEDTFKLIGLNPRAKKYPVIGLNIKNRKKYKFPLQMIKEKIT